MVKDDEFKNKNSDYISNTNGKILINTGSVGQPFDSIFVTYLILEGELNQTQKSDLKIELVRLPYDNVKAVELALQSDMPDKHLYAEEILTGIFRGYRNFRE